MKRLMDVSEAREICKRLPCGNLQPLSTLLRNRPYINSDAAGGGLARIRVKTRRDIEIITDCGRKDRRIKLTAGVSVRCQGARLGACAEIFATFTSPLTDYDDGRFYGPTHSGGGHGRRSTYLVDLFEGSTTQMRHFRNRPRSHGNPIPLSPHSRRGRQKCRRVDG
ncbi:hypothetical protein EVAR_64576_1 [Eumeta japonica]|uniref:Uncharacterized protein n=1 Tax=Eumeta variegata TaxID=151549 RepID=A0A4C1ZGB9_EUMVA|nr:hypothetical protein EVAR_64576_1 [Eumeta japonica]